MGLFGNKGIDAGVQQFKATEGAILLDVRTPGEYADGHIPGAVNVPLNTMNKETANMFPQDTPLFLYCQSGARSSRAAKMMKLLGYTNVTNIGGIMNYNGPIE